MGVLDRLARQRLDQITSHAQAYLDTDENIVRWVRAKNPDGRGEGFIYLTEKHCIVHWRGRPEGPGAVALQDIRTWGIDKDSPGGPLLGIEADGRVFFIQLPVTTRAMAEHASHFVTDFAELSPEPAFPFKHGSHLGSFETDGEVEVEGKPRPLAAHARRVAITFLGVFLVFVGIIITPLPGPWSLPIVIGGLAVLASEYDWAKDALDWVRLKSRAVAAKFKSRRRSA